MARWSAACLILTLSPIAGPAAAGERAFGQSCATAR